MNHSDTSRGSEHTYTPLSDGSYHSAVGPWTVGWRGATRGAVGENMITVRADYAIGKDGSYGVYLGIGEAF